MSYEPFDFAPRIDQLSRVLGGEIQQSMLPKQSSNDVSASPSQLANPRLSLSRQRTTITDTPNKNLSARLSTSQATTTFQAFNFGSELGFIGQSITPRQKNTTVYSNELRNSQIDPKTRPITSADNIIMKMVRDDVYVAIGNFKNSIIRRGVPEVSETLSTMFFKYKQKNVEITEVISSTVEPDGGILVHLQDITRQKELMRIRYRKLPGNIGWTTDTEHPAFNGIVPSNTILSQFNILTWSAYQTIRTVSNSGNAQQKNSLGKGPEILRDHTPDGTLCVGHDMMCTRVSDKITIIVSDWLFNCPIEVDLTDCCIGHDTDLWCGINVDGDVLAYTAAVAYVAATAFKLYGCVLGKCIEAGAKADFFCGGFLTGIPEATAQGIVWGMFYFTATLIFPNGIIDTDLFPIHGEHDNSCLCGGTEPTVLCGKECRNLCKELGKSESCYNCDWSCQYDKGSGSGLGRFIGVQFNRDPSGRLPCCPETDPNGDPLCQKTEAAARDSCNKCFYCYWECGQDGNGYQKKINITKDPVNNLPCCPDSEKDPGGGWCVEDVKHGTKGVV